MWNMNECVAVARWVDACSMDRWMDAWMDSTTIRTPATGTRSKPSSDALAPLPPLLLLLLPPGAVPGAALPPSSLPLLDISLSTLLAIEA